MQVLGNCCPMLCNVVGTNLAEKRFYEKGIQRRTWGNVATPCQMWERELYFLDLPLLIIVRLPELHMLGLWLISLLIAKHPPLISFVFHPIQGGKHQLLIFSQIPYFSFAHLIKSPQFPPQITSSGPSRHVGRWKSRRGGVKALMCWGRQVAVRR